MAWNFGTPIRATPRPVNTTPRPVGSGSGEGGIDTATGGAEDNGPVGSVQLDLGNPTGPLSSSQVDPNAGFGGGLPGQVIGAGTQLLGGALGAIGEGAHALDKLVGAGVSTIVGNRAQQSQLQVLGMFANEPDSPEKQAAQQEMAQHQGDQYAQSQIAFDYLDRQHAYLFPELYKPTDSTASGIAINLLSMIQAPQQVVERTVSGLTGGINLNPLGLIAPGALNPQIQPGGDRIANIQARLADPTTAKDVSGVESYAADKVSSGAWTKQQGLDFLAGHGSGLSSDPGSEIILSMVTDPTILLPGVGEAAKLAGVGARMASLAEDGNVAARAVLGVAGHVNDIVDPVGAIFGRATPTTQIPDDLAKSFNAAAGLAHDPAGSFSAAWSSSGHFAYGYPTRVYASMASVDPTGHVYNQFQKDVATGFANMGRNVLLRRFRKVIVSSGQIGQLLADKIIPDSLIEKLPIPKNFGELFTAEAMRVAKPVETEEEQLLLADRLARAYGSTPEHWMDEIKSWSPNERSFAHLATYGNETGNLVSSVQRILDGGLLEGERINPRNLILMNSNTLTQDGAARIVRELAALEASGSPDEAAAILREAQDQFPVLRGVGSLNTEGAQLARQVARMRGYLEMRIYNHSLPAELSLREAEVLSHADPQLAAMHARGLKGDAPWKLGMAPDELNRWGIFRDSEGQWHEAMDAWPTHVAVNTSGYRPLSAPLRFGANGRPAGYVSTKLADAVDTIENAVNVFTHSVTSAVVTENAHVRFLAGMRKLGLTAEESNDLFSGIFDLVSDRQAPIRSMSPHEIWTEVKHLIPTRLRSTDKITANNLMAEILKAWQGDFRVVGATQWLTGGLKRLDPGHNSIGILAEKIVPFLRYNVSLTFRGQTRVEGIFWNILKGITPAFGVTPDETASLFRQVLDRLGATTGRRVGDLDSSSDWLQAAQAGLGFGDLAGGGRLGQLWNVVANAKSAENLNYLRNIEDGLHDMTREVAVAHGQADTFDRAIAAIKDNAASQGPTRWGDGYIAHTMTDDEAAVRWWHEMLVEQAKPDAVVKLGDPITGFAAEGSVYAPTNMGELRPIDVDGFLRRTPILIKDREIKTAQALRKALAREEVSAPQVMQHLADLNVPPENIDRFMRAARFDWNNFWLTVGKRFGATRGELDQLEGMVAGMARKQNMAPAEFLSQVITPILGSGDGALVNHMGDHLSALRMAQSAAGSTEALTRQLAQVFAANLHPSMQETLLGEFKNLLPNMIQNAYDRGLDPIVGQNFQRILEALKGGWDGEATDEFAKRLMARMAGPADEASPDNPEVERAYRMFSTWIQDVFADGLSGQSPAMQDILKRVGAIPEEYGKPFNLSEALFKDAALDRMAQKENDAFSLIYWRRSRSFAERSINHPMFGLYPSSYMWGKVAPNYIRFLAVDPFGIKTGAGVNAMRNAQITLAGRREFDQSFQAQMDKLGKSEALWFLQYMLPGSPFDITAAAPGWAHELLAQAQDNAKRVANGSDPLPLNLDKLLSSENDFLSPVRGLNAGAQAASELERGAESIVKGVLTPPPPPLSAPVHATNLAPILSPQMQQLQQRLLGQ